MLVTSSDAIAIITQLQGRPYASLENK